MTSSATLHSQQPRKPFPRQMLCFPGYFPFPDSTENLIDWYQILVQSKCDVLTSEQGRINMRFHFSSQNNANRSIDRPLSILNACQIQFYVWRITDEWQPRRPHHTK
jgi:hypothetical protein